MTDDSPNNSPHVRSSDARPPIRKRDWYPAAIVLGPLVAFALVGGVAVNVDRLPSPDFSGPPNSQRAAAPATLEPTTTSLWVTTTTEPASTTSEMTTTRRPPCPKPKTILAMSGRDFGQSKDFNANGDYQVRWSYTPEGDDVGIFSLWLETADGEPVDEMANTRLKDSGVWEGHSYGDSEYRLAINAVGRWAVRIVDMPEYEDLEACGARP